MLLSVSLALAAPTSTPDALLARFDAHLQHESGDRCLTTLVAEIKANWSSFSAADRARLSAVLSPFGGDLMDERPAMGTPAPPDGTATDSCFGQQKTYRLASEHFVVEWDDSITETTAQKFLDALEDGWAVEVEELGWLSPSGSERYLLPAYVAAGNYQSAYTTVDRCGGEWVPYIVAYAGSFSQMSWANTMAVHEFNHSLQFGYGYANEFWWWEATATWIESQVYPSVDWWSYYVTGYTQNTQIAMSASSQDDTDTFYHMYGMAIWAFYLQDYLGGPDVVRQTWVASAEQAGSYNYSPEDALEALGLDFEAAYLDFIVRNTVMDYTEQRAFPQIRMDDIGELPASGESERATAPQGRGQNYFLIEDNLGEGELVFTLDGEDGTDWAVALVAVDGDDIEDQVVAVLPDGQGTVTLPGYGSDEVVVVVSPLSDDEENFNYSWSVEVAAPATPAREEAPDAPACACATGTRAPTWAAALGLLAVAGLRRRR